MLLPPDINNRKQSASFHLYYLIVYIGENGFVLGLLMDDGLLLVEVLAQGRPEGSKGPELLGVLLKVKIIWR